MKIIEKEVDIFQQILASVRTVLQENDLPETGTGTKVLDNSCWFWNVHLSYRGKRASIIGLYPSGNKEELEKKLKMIGEWLSERLSGVSTRASFKVKERNGYDLKEIFLRSDTLKDSRDHYDDFGIILNGATDIMPPLLEYTVTINDV